MKINLNWQHYKPESLPLVLALLGLSLVLWLTLLQVGRVLTGQPATPEVSVSVQPEEKLKPQFEAFFGAYYGNKPLQETGLNFQLTAVFAMDDPLKGSAVISASGRKPMLQIVGDQLPGGVTLKEIHSDYVVLEQAGQQSVLRLPKKTL